MSQDIVYYTFEDNLNRQYLRKGQKDSTYKKCKNSSKCTNILIPWDSMN